jgi:hypothetical protein
MTRFVIPCDMIAGPLLATDADGQGASDWSQAKSNFWMHTTHICARWSDPNTPTSEQSFGCGDLYWFWNDQKVLEACST